MLADLKSDASLVDCHIAKLTPFLPVSFYNHSYSISSNREIVVCVTGGVGLMSAGVRYATIYAMLLIAKNSMTLMPGS